MWYADSLYMEYDQIVMWPADSLCMEYDTDCDVACRQFIHGIPNMISIVTGLQTVYTWNSEYDIDRDGPADSSYMEFRI